MTRKITFCDTRTGEVYTDIMEIHVLELGKLPPEDQNEEGIIKWMRFLNAKSRKELKEMAKQINKLHKRLIELGRIDDLKRAVEDLDYQEQLMKELGI